MTKDQADKASLDFADELRKKLSLYETANALMGAALTLLMNEVGQRETVAYLKSILRQCKQHRPGMSAALDAPPTLASRGGRQRGRRKPKQRSLRSALRIMRSE